jgi:hypothetical protein
MAGPGIALAHLVLEVERRTGHQLGIAYTRLWSMATAGTFPATLIGRRWYVLEEDLPATLAVLGVPDGHAAAGIAPAPSPVAV